MGRTPTPTSANEPAQLAVVLAHVRERVEEVNGTRRRDRELRGGRGGHAESEIEWRRRRGRGVDGAALARATGGGVVWGKAWEVCFGLSTAELASCGVVGTRRLFGRVESAEPDSGLLPRVADLSSVATPRTLPHASVSDLLGVRIRVDGAGSVSGSHLGL